jgi:hypothetical protein
MANHRIPRRRTTDVETLTCYADDGRIFRLRVYRHVREGHTRPEFYVVQYLLTAAGGVDRSTRVTSQFSGARAEARLQAAMTASRKMVAAQIAAHGTPPNI